MKKLKKLSAVLLIALIVIGLLPQVGMTVFAEETAMKTQEAVAGKEAEMYLAEESETVTEEDTAEEDAVTMQDETSIEGNVDASETVGVLNEEFSTKSKLETEEKSTTLEESESPEISRKKSTDESEPDNTLHSQEEAVNNDFVTEEAAGSGEASGDKEKKITFNISAAGVKAKGKWGSLQWTLDTNGLLKISGTGDMDDFSYNSSKAWLAYKDNIKSVSIGSGVKSIGECAFYRCSSLASVSIGSSVTSIGQYAFCYCENLASISIGSSVTSIGDSAFSYCKSLVSVSIGNGVTEIGDFAFSSCKSLASVSIGSNVTSIGAFAFILTGIKSITIPVSVTEIGLNPFNSCDSLEKITVSAGNKAYDSRNNCNAIIKTATNRLVVGCKTSTIPSSVVSISSEAFQGCDGLKNITIPDNVTDIDTCAFSGCSNLESISIGSGVVSMSSSVFIGCSKLKSIAVSAGNKVYDSRKNCNAIIETATNTLIRGCKSTVIPGSIKYISACAFYSCDELVSITIPSGVMGIDEDAFEYCDELESVILPATVTQIGSAAFMGDSKLKDVYYSGTKTQAGKINIGSYNEELKKATWHYNYNSKASTVKLTAKTASYTGKAIKIGTAKVTGSKGKVTYTYYTNSKCTTKTSKKNSGASSTGSAPAYAGTYYVKAKVAADKNYESATSKAVKLVIKKATPTIKVKTSSKTYKQATLKKKAQAFSIGASVTGKGKLSYKKSSGSKYLSVSKTSGKVSVKKGTPKGTYSIKVKVSAKASANYSAANKTFTITVKVGESTIKLAAKTAVYTGKAIKIGTAKTTGSTGKVTYTYYTNSKCTTKTSKKNSGASSTGGAPAYAGTYYVKAKVAADKNYGSAISKAVKLVIKKATPTIKVKTSSKTYKQATLKKKAQVFSIGASVTGKGKLSYAKSSGSKYLSISKTSGKVTVKKGTPKGTYSIKVKVSAKASANYSAASKTFTIKVKVK